MAPSLPTTGAGQNLSPEYQGPAILPQQKTTTQWTEAIEPADNSNMSAELEPSAEMPVVDAERSGLFHLLVKTPSYLGVALSLPRLLREHDDLGITMTNTRRTLTDSEDDTVSMLRHDTNVVLHSIPREVMMSLVQETVAFDFHVLRPNKPKTYSAHLAPGTYAAAMSIQGRAGCFLSRTEIAELRGHLEQYRAACESWSDAGRQWLPSMAAERQFVESIQMPYKYKQGEPYLQRGRQLDMLQTLIEMFAKREDAKLDPQGTVWQKQSPLMIGCSDDIGERVQKHNVARHGLGFTTYTWAITWACIEVGLGLTVEITTIPVVQVTEPHHLPISEMVVTALARSMVTQHGYNVIQAGGRKKTQQRLLYDKQIVLAHLPWLRENIQATLPALAEVQEKLTLRRTFDEIIRSATALAPQVEDACASVKRLLALQDDLRQHMGAMEEAEKALRAERDRLREQDKRQKDQLRVLQALRDAIRQTLGAQGPPEDGPQAESSQQGAPNASEQGTDASQQNAAGMDSDSGGDSDRTRSCIVCATPEPFL